MNWNKAHCASGAALRTLAVYQGPERVVLQPIVRSRQLKKRVTSLFPPQEDWVVLGGDRYVNLSGQALHAAEEA